MKPEKSTSPQPWRKYKPHDTGFIDPCPEAQLDQITSCCESSWNEGQSGILLLHKHMAPCIGHARAPCIGPAMVVLMVCFPVCVHGYVYMWIHACRGQRSIMSTVSQRPSTFCLKRGLHVPRWAGEPRVFSPLQHRNHKHRTLCQAFVDSRNQSVSSPVQGKRLADPATLPLPIGCIFYITNNQSISFLHSG